MNAPNPPHWTLNSCFGALYSVWVHLGSFRNCKKRDAKQGELVQLMQKFMPRSHVGIFRNEHTQSTTLDPNSYFHKFHCVWVHLLSFRNCMKLGSNRCELVQLMQKFVPWSHVRIFCNERPQSTPMDRKLMFWLLHSVWVHLGSFRNCMKLVAKWCELVQLMRKFVPWSHVGSFRNKQTQSTPLDPTLMFWCVA